MAMEGYTIREIIGCSAFILFFLFIQWVECGGKTAKKVAEYVCDFLGKSYYLITVLIRWILVGLAIYFFGWWSLAILVIAAIIITLFKKD